MRLSIVVIGDEILLGQVADTNSGFIARTFCPEGWEVRSILTVGDDKESIRAAIEEAMLQSNLVISTGGLGPTKDDITKNVLLELFGGELAEDQSVLENIRRVFNLRGLKMNPLTEAQALVPTSCKVIQNRFGTAPIMWFDKGEKSFVAMPGVPFETEGMIGEVLRFATAHFGINDSIYHQTLIATGITESDLAARLDDCESSLPEGIHLAYLPQQGYIKLRLDGKNVDKSIYDKALARIKSELGELLIYEGDATPAEILLKALGVKGMTCATAESCTGGNIAHLITSVPGSSASFLGGIVSYANEVKMNLLGVKETDLEQHGAVSREVVEQMAIGACRATGADCSVATSGIAGPGGGSPDKPVGTVWMAWCVKGSVSSHCFRFPGSRQRVIDRASSTAILWLIMLLSER